MPSLSPAASDHSADLLTQGTGELRSLTLTPYPPTICRVIAAR